MTNDDLLLKLEKSSRDKSFFLINKSRLFHTYRYLDTILSNYIDICCHAFKTFKVNKTAYVYGSIVTLAAGILFAKERFFEHHQESNAIEYLARDIFPLFLDLYNSTTLVEAKTQSHMLNGYIDDFMNAVKKNDDCCGPLDSYLPNDVPKLAKLYLNQVARYCVDHKLEGYTEKDVYEELLPFLNKIPLGLVHTEYIFVYYNIDNLVMGFFPDFPELEAFKANTKEELFENARNCLVTYIRNNMTKLPEESDEFDVYYRYEHHKEYQTIKLVVDID